MSTRQSTAESKRGGDERDAKAEARRGVPTSDEALACPVRSHEARQPKH